jgi:hypothetical protein
MTRKHKQRPDSEYGDFWQKEHRRLEELHHQAKSTTSTSNSGEGADSSHIQHGAVFIPMTWLRKRKVEFYSGSDPEWQQFVALSNDLRQAKAVKARLAESVCKDLANHALVTRITGKPLTVYATWLDFVFPSAAPAEYEHSGILWTNNEIAWATRRFEGRQAKKLYRVLLPTALLSSLQGLSSTLFSYYYRSLRSLLSRSENPEHQKPAAKPVAEPPFPSLGQDASKSAPTLSIQKESSTSQQNLSMAATPRVQSELIRIIMPEPEPNSPISAAVREFKLNYLKKWRQSLVDIPRGACILKGEIGVKGPTGRCKMTVVAIYLPKEDAFVHIVGNSTGIWPKNQAPIGRSKPKEPKPGKPELEKPKPERSEPEKPEPEQADPGKPDPEAPSKS